MSGFSNSVTLSQTAEAPEITSFGDDTRQRLASGIKDWEITFSSFFATGANETDVVLSGILGIATLFKFGPSGSTSTCIMYTGCGILSEYNMEFGVDGAATATGTVVARSGSLTRSTWT